MPANVENMFYTGAEPWWSWREVGTSPNDPEAITASGLDWEVGLKDLFTRDGEEVPARATYRKSDNSILGVVGPRYVPLQNREALIGFSHSSTMVKLAYILAVACLMVKRFGFWLNLTVTLQRLFPVTKCRNLFFCQIVTMANCHSSWVPPIRVVCVNTLAFAHQHKESQLLRIRHTRSAKSNLDNVKRHHGQYQCGFRGNCGTIPLSC